MPEFHLPSSAPLNQIQPTMRILRDVFGFHSFRPNQEEIVHAILARQDAVVIMPTGGGKSLCYQLPAHLMDGTCLVISPLISLMKDQVDAALATGLRAAFLNSSLSAAEKRQVESELANGRLDLLYISPERFAMPEFIAALKRISLSFVAIDEAHCISEWGHDFRPDYLNLSTIVQQFPNVPVTAFTATATHKVQSDIIQKLTLRNPHIVRASFNRPNLFYKVVPKQSPSTQILTFVRAHANEPGIIYRTTRNSVEQTAAMLVKNNIKALPYHAGLDDETRVRNQEAFNNDEIDVIVATVAFGMGIDKSNVRYVLHGDLPKNIEGYYQETGRSGRDGEPAICLLLFGIGDIPKLRFFIDQIPDEDERLHALKCLNDMVHFATTHACRRKQLLNYFGEPFEPADTKEAQATCCDICAGEVERIDATIDAQIILSAIARTGERFGINHIISVVTGDMSDRIRQLGHDQIKTFGAGQDKNKRHWRLMIDNLLAQNLIEQSVGDYPILLMQPAARDVLFAGQKVYALKTCETVRSRRKQKASATAGPYNESLFEQLRALRKELAIAKHVPPYIIFTDRTLHEMARFFPSTKDEMLNITGVGETRLAQYGQPFLEAIQTHRAAHPDEPLPEPSTTDQPTPSYMEQARQTHPRAYEKWSDQEDERLRQAWTNLATTEQSERSKINTLASDFARKPGAIKSRLVKLGLLHDAEEV